MFWLQGGLLGATVVLGVKTGLILGTSWLNKRFLVLASALFGSSLYALVLAFGTQQHRLIGLLDKYTFLGSMLMAVLLIYLGLQQEIKTDAEEPKSAGRIKFWLGFLPCPLCLFALAFSVIIISPLLNLSLVKLGGLVALSFTILVLTVAVIIGKLVYLIRFNPATVFNNVLLFIGLVTFTFALFIPNFVQSMQMPLSPLMIGSPRLAGLVFMIMVALGLWGYIINQISYAKECD